LSDPATAQPAVGDVCLRRRFRGNAQRPHWRAELCSGHRRRHRAGALGDFIANEEHHIAGGRGWSRRAPMNSRGPLSCTAGRSTTARPRGGPGRARFLA